MGDVPVCIDISHHQGFPDFDEVRAAGVLGVIHKCSEGCTFVDKNRAENCSNAISAGIAVSTYHWLKPGSARDQMDFYLSTLDPVKGERVVIDYEEDGCTLDDLHEAVQTLKDVGKNLQITVYSGHLLKEQLNGSCDEYLKANTDLWLAQYTSGNPSWSTGTYEYYSLWQYSETGEIPGIDDAYVDLNNFNGNDQNFIRWISPAGQKPPKPEPPKPQPEPAEGIVRVAITSPKGVFVKVTVNGRTPLRRMGRRLIKRGPDILR